MRIAALGLVLLVACSDDPASAPDPEPNEWYALASVDGAELPVVEPDGSTLHSGILDFTGPHYQLTLSWETPSGVGVDSTFAGPYEFREAALVLYDLRDDEDVELSIPEDGILQGEIWPGRHMEFWLAATFGGHELAN